MIDISGRYEFHRDSSNPGLQIVRVSATGQIPEGQIGQSPIQGQLNSDNSVSFNDARQPGATRNVTFYTGDVMLNSDDSVYGMAGTWQEDIGPVANPGIAALASAHPAGRGGRSAAATAVGTEAIAPPVASNTVHGAWFAIRLGPVL